MHRTTITGVDDFTANAITNLWNTVSHSMIESISTDLYYAKADNSLPADDLKILDDTEQTLRRLDNGEQQASPSELRDAVQTWLAYFFRHAETPVGMNLAPVYRLAADLSDIAEVLERASSNGDPWATGAPASA